MDGCFTVLHGASCCLGQEENVTISEMLTRWASVRSEVTELATGSHFHRKRKDAIWKMRWLVLHTFAHLGIDGLVLDSDIVVLQDPFQALKRDADFEVTTDHFWPELHLWQYWTRAEEHINTGCIFVAQMKQEFLEDHNESEVGVIPRHWMDQQVFNKFVQKKMFQSSSDLLHGLYGEQHVYWNPRVSVRATKPIRIRILDPITVAHGMNYFWLRAHQRPGQENMGRAGHSHSVSLPTKGWRPQTSMNKSYASGYPTMIIIDLDYLVTLHFMAIKAQHVPKTLFQALIRQLASATAVREI
eukprot:Skav212895  [mRNA]  locus=scaffold374:21753:26353:+ [translate_table: standard]